ncbi:MAG: class I SAM-dependent methyltransferase [Cytophagales bacterium]|nr:class I SAM-dependent methyltransferase [Rhizobacter sp.]
MNPTPFNTDPEPAVHLPHQPLPSYYASDDLEARERFLRNTFDDTAVDYNRLERILGFGTGSRYRRMALQRAGLQPGMQVLDVGMGTGLVSQEILHITQEPSRLIGVDPSPGMMAQSKLPAVVQCRLGRAEELPVPDASVDFLVMGYALRHIADFSLACAEFRRVLKPGGRLLILEITRPRGRVATALLKAYMRGAVPLLARAVSKAPSTPMLWRYYWDTIATCIAPPQVLATLAAAGLHGASQHLEVGIFSEYTARG